MGRTVRLEVNVTKYLCQKVSREKEDVDVRETLVFVLEY